MNGTGEKTIWTIALVMLGFIVLKRVMTPSNELTSHLKEEQALQRIGQDATVTANLATPPYAMIGSSPLMYNWQDVFDASNPGNEEARVQFFPSLFNPVGN